MSYSRDNGYTPVEFNSIMSSIRQGINTQFGTSYTSDDFVGTNWYKFMYPLVQKVQEGEIKTSEIFLKLQEYINFTNLMINRPSVTYLGLSDAFSRDGYIISVKEPADADAGKIFICVDTDETADDYADVKHDLCTKIKDYVSAGLVTQGTEVESITLSNGQAFDFKYALPNRIDVLLKVTITVSNNLAYLVPEDDIEIRQTILDNVTELYRVGFNFEPQRYYSQAYAPWASVILLEWSDNSGATWQSSVFVAEYDDKFTFDLDDIEVVIT